MQPKTFRAFFAIDLPEDIKKAITTVMQPLHVRYAKQINWTKPDNIHLTLCFLGNITDEQFQAIDEKIKKVSKKLDPFTMKLTALLPFPSLKKFHTLSLKPEPLPLLTKSALIIAREVTACGIKLDKRPFKPHITLGRINNQAKINNKIFTEIKLPAMSFTVTEIKLFKSESQPGGSVYTPVAVYNF